jgi:4-oxalocrotonate tautomerase
MPLIELKLYDRRVNDESAAKMISELTEALVRATGDEGVRDHTQVIVYGVSPKHWGVAGKQGS